MTSIEHDDAATIADTVADHDNVEWDSYEESLAETATVVDSASVKEGSSSKSLALVQEKYYNYDATRSSRPGLFKVIRGISSLPFRAITSATSIAQRLLAMCNADMQIRGTVLANAAVIHRRYSTKSKLSGRSKYMITDIPPKQRALRERLREINRHCEESRGSTKFVDYSPYVELIHTICTIVRAPTNTYDESLFWRAWDLLIQEMTSKHAAVLVEALCSPECEGEDVGTVLRHLALSRLSGWKKRSGLKNADPETASEMARIASFSSDTYASFLSTNEGFFSLLSNLIQQRPWTVHEALDAHVYLVWFKYAIQPWPLMTGQFPSPYSSPAQLPEIKWGYVLDNISVAFHQYTKRLDPALPAEARSFIHFIGSKSDAWASEKLEEPLSGDLSHLIAHLSNVLARVAAASESTDRDNRGKLHEFCDKQCCETPPNFDTDAMFQLFREQPGLASAELAHPVLPVVCVLAELVKTSQSAVIEITRTTSMFECLCRLWNRQFLLPSDYRWGTWSGAGAGPGRWVIKDKRTYAMRLATCFFVAQLTKAATYVRSVDAGRERMDALARCFTATPVLRVWIWEVVSAALVFQNHFTKLVSQASKAEVPLTKEQQKDRDVHQLYADVLRQVQRLVQHLRAHENKQVLADTSPVVPVEKLVLIFEDVLVEVPAQVLGSILGASTTSKEWNAAITILEACNTSNAAHFRRALTHFVQQLLAGTAPGTHARVAQMLRRSVSSLDLSREARRFMPHPADRFLMLLVSAAERRPFVAEAIRKDSDLTWAVFELIRRVQVGAYDDPKAEVCTETKAEQMRWRELTCSQLRAKISLSQAR